MVPETTSGWSIVSITGRILSQSLGHIGEGNREIFVLNSSNQIVYQCKGIGIGNKLLLQQVANDHAADTFEFADQIDQLLHAVPQPEYRQLLVETLVMLHLLIEHDVTSSLGDGIIDIEQLVRTANNLFLEDQKKTAHGDSLTCCAKSDQSTQSTSLAEASATPITLCGGSAGICRHFYDSAPSGTYGTMSYLTRAIAHTLDCCHDKHEVDCNIA